MQSYFLSLPPKAAENPMNYTSKILLLGSCFSGNIGEKLAYYQFQTSYNPFGILFHPQAIFQLLTRALTKRYFTKDDIFEHQDLWHCFEVHSEMSQLSTEALVNVLNERCDQLAQQVTEATHIILTFGTAWHYEHEHYQGFVANCHKVPQTHFEKQLSTSAVLKKTFQETIDILHQYNPKLEIITTISPVRHIRDGIVENNRSKAALLSSLHEVVAQYTNVHYYPAYELVVDCLRDYRFYKADLVHPNEMAVDYVWEHFQETYLHETATRQVMKRVYSVQKGLAHKAFNPDSVAHQQFLKKLAQKQESLRRDFPFMHFQV